MWLSDLKKVKTIIIEIFFQKICESSLHDINLKKKDSDPPTHLEKRG
jgi:hypothetical protein